MIKATIDSRQVKKDLERRLAQTQRTEVLMRRVAGDLERSTEKNFAAQGREPRWKGLKESTLERRAAQNKTGRILQVNGNLKNSVVSKYNKFSAVAGSNLVYARIHQFGGKAGRNGSAKIPARPYLKLTKQDQSDITERVRKFFA